jgi:hypothetical protein
MAHEMNDSHRLAQECTAFAFDFGNIYGVLAKW